MNSELEALIYRDKKFWREYILLKIDVLRASGLCNNDIEKKLYQEADEWAAAMENWPADQHWKIKNISEAYKEMAEECWRYLPMKR